MMSPGTEPLKPPKEDKQSAERPWEVLASTHRINKDWIQLIERAPENTLTCYSHLRNNPTKRIPGRAFPLRGKKYAGAWEYEVTSGDRVFYVPILETRTVIVYYAGEHPPKAPYPSR